MELVQVVAPAGRDLEEHQPLQPALVGVGVVEDPLAVGRVRAVPVLRQHVRADDRRFAAAAHRPCRTCCRPSCVRAHARMVVSSCQSKCETMPSSKAMRRSVPSGFAVSIRVCQRAVVRLLPAVQEDEPRAAGIEQQVVDPVMRALEAIVRLERRRVASSVTIRSFLPVFDVHPPDAELLRGAGRRRSVRVARVAVAGPQAVQPGEVERHRLLAVGAEGVDRPRQRPRSCPCGRRGSSRTVRLSVTVLKITSRSGAEPSHWSIVPCCQHHAVVLSSGMNRSPSFRSTMPTVSASSGASAGGRRSRSRSPAGSGRSCPTASCRSSRSSGASAPS